MNNQTSTSSLVSVIIPTYNRVERLISAMESVLSQTYRPIELIVVDDGSTDNTKERVATWMENKRDDNFLTKYMFQKNSGAPAARNAGIRVSCGHYLHFLDSDCHLHPDKFKIQTNVLEDETYGFSYDVTQFTDMSGDVQYTCGQAPEDDFLLNAVSENFTCIAPLWKKDALCGVFWDEDLFCRQDWIFKIRILLNSVKGRYINRCLSTAVLHEDNRISAHDSLDFISGHAAAVIRAYELIKKLNDNRLALKYLSGKMLSISKSYLKIGNFQKADQALRKCIAISSGIHIKAYLITFLWRFMGPEKSYRFLKVIGRLSS